MAKVTNVRFWRKTDVDEPLLSYLRYGPSSLPED